MSGFEVVGVVLGAIPLILEVVKMYSSMADYMWELKILRRCLETEHVILHNTCEKLLVSIVPVARIGDFLKEPFGPLWKTQEALGSLRQRLWTSYQIFEETVQEMKNAVTELGGIFGVNILTQASVLGDQKSFKDRLGEKFKLYLKKDQIRNLRKIIENGNLTLTKLLATSVDRDVEGARQRQSRGRYLKLTQQCSSNALAALETSICCRCRAGHSLNLKLPLLTTYPTPADNDEDIVKGVIFEITFASASLDQMGKPFWSKWKELELHTHIWEQQKNTQTTVSVISPLPPQTIEITNLCHEIDSAGTITSQIECYGLIKAESPLSKHYFRVNSGRHNFGFSSWSGKSLENLLSSGSQNTAGWRFRHKQILAAKVASSVLQFSESQWLPDFLTSADITFMEKTDPSFFEHPFVIKRLPKDGVAHQYGAEATSGLPHDLLFSLGVVLLEVSLGKSLNNLRQDSGGIISTTTDRDFLADYELAIKHLNQVEQAMGTHYSQAVRHCLKCEFMSPVLDLENDEFRDEVYRKVVAPLEENVSVLNMKFETF